MTGQRDVKRRQDAPHCWARGSGARRRNQNAFKHGMYSSDMIESQCKLWRRSNLTRSFWTASRSSTSRYLVKF